MSRIINLGLTFSWEDILSYKKVGVGCLVFRLCMLINTKILRPDESQRLDGYRILWHSSVDHASNVFVEILNYLPRSLVVRIVGQF